MPTWNAGNAKALVHFSEIVLAVVNRDLLMRFNDSKSAKYIKACFLPPFFLWVVNRPKLGTRVRESGGQFLCEHTWQLGLQQWFTKQTGPASKAIPLLPDVSCQIKLTFKIVDVGLSFDVNPLVSRIKSSLGMDLRALIPRSGWAWPGN